MRLFVLVLSLLIPCLSLAQKMETQVLLPFHLEKRSDFVPFIGEVNNHSMTQFIAELSMVAAPNKSVTVFVDSPGGSVIAGMYAIEAVKALRISHPGLRLTCYIHSAASMAFHFVQLACDKRVVSEVSILMQHQASAGMGGKWGEIESRVVLIRQIIDILDKRIAARLRLTVPAYRELIVNDWWLVGRSAIRARAADILGTLSCSAELVKSGGCPLTGPVSSAGGHSQETPAPSEEQKPSQTQAP